MKHPEFVWARNRNAAGRGSDPYPMIIHEPVGVSHVEIVTRHPISAALASSSTIDHLAECFPAPAVE